MSSLLSFNHHHGTHALTSLSPRRGVLLINIGSPASLRWWAVAAYLRAFLTDRRVIDIHAVWRLLLVNLLIVPFRTSTSRRAYRKIWRREGAPLLFFTQQCQRALDRQLPATVTTAIAMRYGQPSLAAAITALGAQNIEQLIILPLFPQYASAANGSAIEAALRLLARQQKIPQLRVINYFYDKPFYQQALSASIANYLQQNLQTDFLLFSYHGLPQRQLPCQLAVPDCCAAASEQNRWCYRFHCLATTRAVAQQLQLPRSFYTTAFQSRLAGTPWIKPWSDVKIKELAQRGVKHLAVVCPSFVADCLETLEEVGIRMRADFVRAGGKELRLIPCLNAEPQWVEALRKFLVEL